MVWAFAASLLHAAFAAYSSERDPIGRGTLRNPASMVVNPAGSMPRNPASTIVNPAGSMPRNPASTIVNPAGSMPRDPASTASAPGSPGLTVDPQDTVENLAVRRRIEARRRADLRQCRALNGSDRSACIGKANDDFARALSDEGGPSDPWAPADSDSKP